MTSTETPARRLLLMRHAKAEAFAADDHDRALTERGRDDAAEVGRWLAERDLVPDHAFVSPATRTTQTWEQVAAASGATATPVYDAGLYSAGPEAALEVLVTAEPSATTLLFVGHNPTVAYLAHVLSDGLPDPDAFRAMSQGYPTAAVTVLDVPLAWADLAEATARISDFHVGHG